MCERFGQKWFYKNYVAILCREIKLYVRKLCLDNFISSYGSIFVLFQESYIFKNIILALYKIFFNLIRE